MKVLNELRVQLSMKLTLIAIYHQCITINTNIAEVQTKNVVFSPLDNVELLDWTTANKFARFCSVRVFTTLLFSNYQLAKQ
jgi:hypothetical protein